MTTTSTRPIARSDSAPEYDPIGGADLGPASLVGSGGMGSGIGGAFGFLLGTGMVISGAFAGTATARPPQETQVRYTGEWTSTFRVTVDLASLVAHVEPARTGHVVDPPALTGGADDAPAPLPAGDQASVRWLHAESGLTWEQLGRLFGVSRRAVHLWANGGRMNAANAESLNELVGIVRELPAADRDRRRALLLAPGSDGRSIVDRFRARQASRAGDVDGPPFTPEQLLGARHGDASGPT